MTVVDRRVPVNPPAGRFGAISARVLAEIEQDSHLDGFIPAIRRSVLLGPVVGGLVLLVLLVVWRRLFYWLSVEDHPLEWFQFGLLATTAGVAALAAARSARWGRYGPTLVLALAAVMFLGLAGEEISWGQRAFDVTGAAALEGMNKQHEINLHNLDPDGISFDLIAKVIELVLAGAGLALALLARVRRGVWNSTWLWWVAPPLVCVPGFVIMAGYQVVMLGTGMDNAPMILLQEWAEICLYLGFAVAAVCCYGRAARGRYVTIGDGRRRQVRRDPEVAASWLPVLVIIVGTGFLTLVLAQLTAGSSIVPGNVPPGLRDLYGWI